VSGISWAICKSAPRSKQITTPASHHSVFYRPDALPAAQTNSVKALKAEVGPLSPARESRECCKLPQRGLGQTSSAHMAKSISISGWQRCCQRHTPLLVATAVEQIDNECTDCYDTQQPKHNTAAPCQWMTCNTHTRLTALFPGLPRWAGTRKVKPIGILLKQDTVSGSGISWAICKSAPSSRQITMPAPHHSVCLQAGCPSCRPTNSVKALEALKWRKINKRTNNQTEIRTTEHVRVQS